MQTVKQGRSLYLDAARVMAIISITLNHAVNRSYDNYNNQMGEFFRIAFASTLFKTVITVFSRIGVPLFLMITGALILNKKMETKEDVHRFYKHNLLSIFITAEIWYVLIYWLMTLPELGKSIGKDAANDKLTAVSAYGLEGAKQRAGMLADKARNALGKIPADTAFFAELLESMLNREN